MSKKAGMQDFKKLEGGFNKMIQYYNSLEVELEEIMMTDEDLEEIDGIMEEINEMSERLLELSARYEMAIGSTDI